MQALLNTNKIVTDETKQYNDGPKNKINKPDYYLD